MITINTGKFHFSKFIKINLVKILHFSEPSAAVANDDDEHRLEEDFENIVQLDTNEIHEINNLDTRRDKTHSREEHYHM